MRRSLLLAMVLVAGTISLGGAEVPELLNYQGVLTDAVGTAVPDGAYDITFRIYDVSSGGSPLWEETQTGVQVTKGIFDVMLGSVMSLDIPFDVPYYLGISVEGEPELSPRIALSSAAYSYTAKGVYGDGNIFPSEGKVGIGITTPSHPLHIVSNELTGIRIDGTVVGSWANITLNAQGAGSVPSYEYYRQGSYRGRTFLDAFNNWHLQLGIDRMISALSGSGTVGVGTDTPLERLDVNGALRLGTTTGSNAGTIRWTGADFEGYDGSSWKSLTAGGSGSLPSGVLGQTLRHDGASWIATGNLYNDGTNVGIGTASPGAPLHVGGEARIGTDAADGSLKMYRAGIADPMVTATTTTHGADLIFFDELNNTTGALMHDGNGEGGYFYVKRDPTYTAFRVDGNYLGTNNPMISMFGSSVSAAFDMGTIGNSSVQLPANSIGSTEIENEAGVASFLEGTNGVALETSVTVIGSRSITAPAAGYVLVLGTCQAEIWHTNGTASSCDVGVSDDPAAFPNNQEVWLRLNSNLPGGYYDLPLTFHGLFQCTGGAHTYYLIGRLNTGDIDIYDVQLTCMYIPTAYGTVTPTLAGAAGSGADGAAGPGLSTSDLAAERAASEAANIARIEREIAELRAQFEALKISPEERE